MTRSRDMMEAAQKSYGTALRLMNHALADPIEAVKDTTMLCVLILGVFEMMTENGPRAHTLEAFQEHVNGAAALAIMRGRSQFKTSAGKRMFAMLCQRVVINCIQRAMPFPAPLQELYREMIKSQEPGDPSAWITTMMFEVLQIRSDVHTGVIMDPEIIVEKLLALEEQYDHLVEQVPASWLYRTFKLSRHHPAVFGGFVHLYPSLWHATIWNSLRTTRILVLETILSQIYLQSQAYPPSLCSERYVEEFAKAKRKLRHIVQDTIASVPQHLGLVNPTDGTIEGLTPMAPPISTVEVRETPSPPTSPSTRSDSVSSATLSIPELMGQPNALTILDVTGAQDPEENAHRFMQLASATSTIVWPLFMVGMSSACSTEAKSYIIDRLRTLYMETGIRQADSIANLLVEHETCSAWLETPLRADPYHSTLVLPPMIKFEEYELQLEALQMERERGEVDWLLV